MQQPLDLKERVAKGSLLMDGAYGTQLYQRGIFINKCFEEANVTRAELVKQLHQDYWDAGARAITTNSWGANAFKLQEHNLHDQLESINVAAVRNARSVVGEEGYVLGSMGPLGVRLEPYGPCTQARAQQAFSEQARALIAAGVDAILLETFVNLDELAVATEGVREACKDIYLIGSTVVREDGTHLSGASIEWVFQKLEQWDLDGIGLNCSVGPLGLQTAIEKVLSQVSKPIFLRPNAGLPRVVSGRQIYLSSPEYFAHFTRHFLKVGIKGIGGCCGTGPEHIRAMSNAMRHGNAMQKSTYVLDVVTEPVTSQQSVAEFEPVDPLERSQWAKKIALGEMVSAIELLPPQGLDPTQILERAAQSKDAGIDVVNIPDGPRASARMSAGLTALLIEEKVGIETVLHYTCRDRNLVGMQSDMLGFQATGLRNMLLVTGDPPKLGNYPDVTGVFDVDAIGLTHMVRDLNHGKDIAGCSIKGVTRFSIGVGVNPGHQDLSYELDRLEKKVAAGAEWMMTQPVFDLKMFQAFLDQLAQRQILIPVIAGVWPLVSYRNAVFMHNEVPGIEIPDEVMKLMADARTPEQARAVGVEVAHRMVQATENLVQGFQVSAPFGRVDLALGVLGRT
ncbi:MAG: bifunctional homocysteine S-methyltransferase/methylenetetrahydrofolate reductase [Zetaproteobacteria bacterium]|nr:bifunctional homocysteine S-methyltransferase/methylenetetrahydrofolate reductase [Zetaproteobacteria bacterium]